MYSKNNNLASLLSSRICHDLANPMGAISNGLELMGLSGTERTPEFELTSDSVQNANAKLAFFRISYGPTKGPDLSATQIVELLDNVYASTRMHIQFEGTENTPRALAKLIFLLIQCLESSLPRGGAISISGDQNSTVLKASGIKLNCENANWNHLLGHQENPAMTPSEVHFEMARIALEDISKSIDLITDTDSAEIRI